MIKNNSDIPVTRPAVGTLTSALKEIEVWSDANDYRQLTDASGMVWKVETRVFHEPTEGSVYGLTWVMTVRVYRVFNAQSLQDHKILDKEEDDRLLQFVGSENLEVTVHEERLEASDEDQARSVLSNHLSELRSTFKTSCQKENIRLSLCEWIDETQAFL